MPQNDLTIDLRSDTVTQPTEEMRRAMYSAEVGDDVLGEDPTVIQLESLAADMFNKDAALLTSSGSMSNLIAVLTHCSEGDKVIMGSEAHMFWNESGATSSIGRVQIELTPNDNHGMIGGEDLVSLVRGSTPQSSDISLLCLENTHNRCNGGVLTPEYTEDISKIAHGLGMKVHLDGARIFNAAVYLRVPVEDLVRSVDDVSFCLSKGLSAPVGSVLCGTQKFISEARKWRKILGGGMRQSGIIAAAGIVAIKTMIHRLENDHSNAEILARGLATIEGIQLDPSLQQTNIVLFSILHESAIIPSFLKQLADHNLKISNPGGDRLRLVTHRHITSNEIEMAISTIKHVMENHLD